MVRLRLAICIGIEIYFVYSGRFRLTLSRCHTHNSHIWNSMCGFFFRCCHSFCAEINERFDLCGKCHALNETLKIEYDKYYCIDPWL